MDDEGAFFEFVERDFTELDKEFEDSAVFIAHLYKLFFQVIWNNLRAVLFVAKAYKAFKTQKDHLLTKVCKPF